MKKIKLKQGEVLVLKSVNADMTAYNGFVWPVKGKCVAQDWELTQECGAGLHGWLWGEGDADLRVKSEDAKWLVMLVKLDTVIELGGKVKFPKCNVIFCGERHDAVAIIQEHAPAGNKCIFGTATAGDSGTATAGYSGTATAGYRGTATAGYSGVISIMYYDLEKEKFRRKIALVDGVNFLPGVKYRLNDAHEFEAVKDEL